MTDGLLATTIALPEPPDLLAQAGDDGFLFRHPGGGIAARGIAARLDLPDGLGGQGAAAAVAAALRDMAVDDAVGGSGTGPIAIGALPFDPREPGHLVVPERVFGVDGDRCWMTVIEPIDAGPAPVYLGPIEEGSRTPPDGFSIETTMPHGEWKEAVANAVERIDGGDLEKVVLARRVDIRANRPFVISDVLERLAYLYPSCTVYSVDGFLGASPELLIKRTGSLVESHPLAGTVARSGDTAGDDSLVAGLRSSVKARHEHRVVVEGIAAALGPVCRELDVPDEPSVLGLRNVSHLATRITGQLADSRHGPSALELVALIHPTPAVCGRPTEAALQYLQKAEGFDRGRYAGPVGWMDGHGDGCFALGIRCAEVDREKASIYAGNGIVSGSDPAEELAETQLKLQALLAAVVRP